ncbi:MAG: alcohol dehydrogenase catalytic domain-containing protein [bacterium]
MKTGVYYNNRDVRVQELPVPKLGDKDILVKVMACGICGSDIMEWYRIKRAPLVLGHELSGEVVEIGRQIGKFKKGERVFSTHHVPCNACHYCLNGSETACKTFQTVNNHDPGGFSQYLRITGRSLDTGTFIMPEGMTYEQGSFIEPLGTAVRGLRTAQLKPGESLLVLGSGIAGLLIIKLARALGAGKIIASDISDYRMRAAERFGADHVINAKENIPEFVRQINMGRLADKVMICTGALSACKQGMESVDGGGIIILFAVPKPGEKISIDFNPFWRNDVSIKTCYGAAPIDNTRAMEMISLGNVIVDDMITHRYGIDEIARGFATASQGENSLKVIINPNMG